MIRSFPIVVAILAIAAACATNPATGKRQVNLMSEAQEISAGQEADAQVKKEMGIYNDPTLQAYVSGIGMRLAKVSERPTLPWHYTVVDSPAINAFALPGGYIYITRGILPFLNDEAQLAGVLGHETGHVTARHAAQQYTRAVGGTVGLVALGIFVPGARPFGQIAEQGLGVLFLKFGREVELQADQLGARVRRARQLGSGRRARHARDARTARRGVGADAKAFRTGSRRIPSRSRASRRFSRRYSSSSAGRTDFVRNQDAMLRAVDGLIYGDNPDQGIVRGTAFIHPPLRFRIDFPTGWDIQNSPEEVVAKAPGADVYMLLEQVEKPQGNGIENIARGAMQDAGFTNPERQPPADQRARRVRRRLPGAAAGPRQCDDARGAHRSTRGTSTWSPAFARRRCSSSPTTRSSRASGRSGR